MKVSSVQLFRPPLRDLISILAKSWRAPRPTVDSSTRAEGQKEYSMANQGGQQGQNPQQKPGQQQQQPGQGGQQGGQKPQQKPGQQQQEPGHGGQHGGNR